MDHNDREQFWKTLCSLPGNDIVAEREQLFKSIKYPKLLFRYRPVSTKSLEALRTNKLYFLLRIIMMILLIPFFTSTLKRSGKSI